ncbi:hypothetical protein [Methylobacterium platani]|uniref:Uncharacterized protein n=2 Tax=Methylobacterium platani TaxID=427683 RepID=A0A179S5J4_9HYPH|nr:hypothetical protein [Methylobacterium platani]KMO20633.1 hypothetical protein SQ03_05215 [Methylobacterium platani JCM 14648]OAS22216.1 hypothetical protein A5481_19810 [Methylobacterium platani]
MPSAIALQIRQPRAAGPTGLALPPLHPATAWAGLPPETRDALGTTLVDLVFQDFLSGAAYAEEDRVLTDDGERSTAIERAERLLNRIYDDVAAALPTLFGPAGENPAWVEDYRAGRLTISNEGVLS